MSEQIVKREHRTRPAAFGEAFWFSFFMGLGLCVGSAAAIYAIQYTQPMTLAFTVGAAGFVLMLLDRKREHDNRAYNITEQILQETTEPIPEPRIYPVIQNTTSMGQDIIQGQFKLSYGQWAALARVFILDGKPLARENIEDLKIFTKITKNWSLWIRAEFMRLGWFSNEGNITAKGSRWFSQFLPPPPHINGKALVTPETTTDDDGNDGGQTS